MFIIIGYVIILLSAVGTYALHGSLAVLWVPAEYLAITGLMIGGYLASNDFKVSKATMKDTLAVFRRSPFSKAFYIELFSMMLAILIKIRKDGILSIEADIDAPQDSPLFADYPLVARDHHVVAFLCDYLRMMVTSNLNVYEIETVMNEEILAHHKECHTRTSSMAKLADALPAFGIVVAVMGVINVMASVSEPPEVLGQMIAGALVGTFLGILISYGFLHPLANKLEQRAGDSAKVFECIKTVLIGSLHGYPPQMAIEFGRKVLFTDERPAFVELESALREGRAS